MTNLRITGCPLGPIRHRTTTTLRRIDRCREGHEAPRYSNNGCVVCAKIRLYEGRPAVHRPNLWRFSDYAEARAVHEDHGGWLLRLDDGRFGVSNNPEAIARHRSLAWMQACDDQECWDENGVRRMTKPHKIERIYAWIVTEANGEDGIPAFYSPQLGATVPMIGSDRERMESMRRMATEVAAARNLPLRLVEFSAMDVLETIPAQDPTG